MGEHGQHGNVVTVRRGDAAKRGRGSRAVARAFGRARQPKATRRRAASVFAMVAAAAALLAAAPSRACDLALVLAVDVSSSVSRLEYALQREGHARTFRDPDIGAAIEQVGGISVVLVHWSGNVHQQARTEWTRLRTAAEARDFADALGSITRRFDYYGTALGQMLTYLETAWTADVSDCARRVIDISGDGVSNTGVDVGPPRARLTASGVTINGLVIVNDELVEADPSAFYRDRVIGGPGAFMEIANDFEDYARAFKQKLLREIKGPVYAALSPTQDPAP